MVAPALHLVPPALNRRPTPVPGRDLDGPDLHALITAQRQLARRGCTAEIIDAGLPGQPDVRLLARRPGSSVSVELLGPCLGPGQREHWCAVRIDPLGMRTLWDGPTRPCPTKPLVTFVHDLTGDDLHLLAARYVAVG